MYYVKYSEGQRRLVEPPVPADPSATDPISTRVGNLWVHRIGSQAQVWVIRETDAALHWAIVRDDTQAARASRATIRHPLPTLDNYVLHSLPNQLRYSWVLGSSARSMERASRSD